MDDDRLSAIETRLAALERAAPVRVPRPAAEEDPFWALEGLRERAPDRPAILFAGIVDLPSGRHAEWQQGHPADELVEQDWETVAPALAALGHPVRLRLLGRIVRGEGATAAELVELEQSGTTGQAYHHLRQLVAEGWLRRDARGRHDVPPERLVPLLVVLAACRR